MTNWQPLSVRSGKREEDGPFEGVPVHLRTALLNWFDKFVATQNGRTADLRLQAIAVRLKIDSGRNDYESALKQTISTDPERFLDILDLGLNMLESRDAANDLNVWLNLGGSVWTVGDDKRSLVRRVTDVEADQYEAVVSPSDAASSHLREAWAAVYGRRPDPSAAWDDCIKACEAVLKPIVPNTLTMGSVVGTIRSQPHNYTLHLKDNASDPTKRVIPLATFEQMLHFIWVNADRHQGPDHRVPTLDEARAVLHLSITVVEWARTGILTKP